MCRIFGNTNFIKNKEIEVIFVNLFLAKNKILKKWVFGIFLPEKTILREQVVYDFFFQTKKFGIIKNS